MVVYIIVSTMQGHTYIKGNSYNSIPAISYNYRRVSANVISSTWSSNLLAFMRKPQQKNTLLPILR